MKSTKYHQSIDDDDEEELSYVTTTPTTKSTTINNSENDENDENDDDHPITYRVSMKNDHSTSIPTMVVVPSLQAQVPLQQSPYSHHHHHPQHYKNQQHDGSGDIGGGGEWRANSMIASNMSDTMVSAQVIQDNHHTPHHDSGSNNNNNSNSNSNNNNGKMNMEETEEERKKRASRWYRWTHSQFMVHSVMVIHLLLFGGFCVLNPLATKHINTFIFSCWRILIMFFSLLPFAIIVNWKFVFRTTTANGSGSGGGSDANDQSPTVKSSGAMGCTQWIISRVPMWRELGLMALCGLMQVLNIVLFTYGTNLTSPTIAGILQPTTTIFTCIISVVLRREGFSVLKTIGVLIAFIGSLLMFVFSGIVHHSGNPFKLVGWTGRGIGGCILLVIGGICTAVFLIAQKTLLNKKIPPLVASVWSLGFASVFSVIVSLIFINGLTVSKLPAITWVGVFYAGLCFGSINYAMTAYAAKLTSPTVISIYTTAYPLVSIVFLLIFLQETSTWLVVIGAGVISLGVTLVAIGQKREGNWQRREALRKAHLIGSENMGSTYPSEGFESDPTVDMHQYSSETMQNMVASATTLKPKFERVVSSFDEYDDEDDNDLRKY